MKVAITAQGQELSSPLDLRFGRAKWLICMDTEGNGFSVHDNAVNLHSAQGAGIQTAQNVVNLGVEAVITGNVGPNAMRTLRAGGVKVFFAAAASAEAAVALFKGGALQEASEANVEGHWV
ncbi:MAG TPA: NifB/NifX family molybdenum-iron cluster-binding protein [Anaerohalosphaeraceae bacterium]|jgi:predicted Fe-Mo cluster-binding NifX family protein|nr:NifB/NifX family molybdenum-iron cluster-binding protein [Anaerohalosphaeraceae bacterium]HRT52254.1 NifB/NifX family molybdenum-iron cluster-binding protein [Anaerohalosphaeraceae bacterium]HRT87377.1 NifB/NifX family molybdenum-iron cluster-binding protein [Anaerohalosphaeraceae bacterium]